LCGVPVFLSFIGCEPTYPYPLVTCPNISLPLLFLSTSIDSTAEAAASAKPREGDGRRLGGAAERPRHGDEVAVGEPALLLADGAAALLRGCAAARRTAEGAGVEAFRHASVAGGRGRIGTGVFQLLRFLES
jgi:hypothetical protein